MAEPLTLAAGPDFVPSTTISSDVVEADRAQIRNAVNDHAAILLELLTALGASTSRAGLPNAVGANKEVLGSDGTNPAWTRALDLASLVLDAPLAVDQGGTGATDAATARTNLGVDIGGAIQAHDDLLDAIAALVTAADRMIYTTGVDTVALATLTAYGRSIMAVASEAALKALINLEIGTDVQAQDAELQAIADLTSAANKGIHFTGSGTAAVHDQTAVARTFLAAATVALQRAALGLDTGDAVTFASLLLSGNIQVQGQGWSDLHTFSDAGGAVPIDGNNGLNQLLTLTGDGTLSAMTNPKPGAIYNLFVKQGAGAPNTLAYDAVYFFRNDSVPVHSTVADEIDWVTIACITSTQFLCSVAKGWSP